MGVLRVLIVDDEHDFVQPLVERLAIRGVDAQGVTSCEEALLRLEQASFDVVVLDIKMPGIGGIGLLEEIKKQNPGQKVVLLTGHGSAQDVNEGIRLGASDCLMKPVSIETLLAVLRSP